MCLALKRRKYGSCSVVFFFKSMRQVGETDEHFFGNSPLAVCWWSSRYHSTARDWRGNSKIYKFLRSDIFSSRTLLNMKLWWSKDPVAYFRNRSKTGFGKKGSYHTTALGWVSNHSTVFRFVSCHIKALRQLNNHSTVLRTPRYHSTARRYRIVKKRKENTVLKY